MEPIYLENVSMSIIFERFSNINIFRRKKLKFQEKLNNLHVKIYKKSIIQIEKFAVRE